jgi:geranylgeranyl reductase family protein
MRRCDAVVVGGGPAGSSCAWALRRAGADVVVLDRASFPRDKVCAGWVTPAVVSALALDTEDYRRGRTFQPISAFRTGLIDDGAKDVETRYGRPVSFGIRRCEFDHYLLRRAGAEVRPGTPVTSLRREHDRWIVNEEIEAPILVGAGGHFCPVARHLGGGGGAEPVVAAQEFEVPLEGGDCPVRPESPELYFARDLKGYGWCFRKQGVVNVGYGRFGGERLGPHVAAFLEFLRKRARLPASVSGRLKGHAYLLYSTAPRPLVGDGVLLVGDAAGLAYAPSGEGIRTAVESGLLAAQTIRECHERYGHGHGDLAPYRSRIEARFGRRRSGGGLARLLPARAVEALGAGLLASRFFTRRVVLDRWFLHAHQPALSPAPRPSA